MTRLTYLIIVCLVMALGGVSCTVNNAADFTQTAASTQISLTAIPVNPSLTNLVGELRNSPEKAWEQVEITGYFRGWDLLHEVGTQSPLTRSDWVITDNSGAIYVTGLMPDDLDPSSPDQVWQIIHLVAIVKVKGDQVYLEANSIELFPNQ